MRLAPAPAILGEIPSISCINEVGNIPEGRYAILFGWEYFKNISQLFLNNF